MINKRQIITKRVVFTCFSHHVCCFEAWKRTPGPCAHFPAAPAASSTYTHKRCSVCPAAHIFASCHKTTQSSILFRYAISSSKLKSNKAQWKSSRAKSLQRCSSPGARTLHQQQCEWRYTVSIGTRIISLVPILIQWSAIERKLIPILQADDPNDIASAMPLTPGVLARPQSSPLSSVGGDVDFRYGWNANSHSTPELKRPGTAAAIAYSKYGDAVKIDSALCKKVAVEMALRDPEQRRPDQRLNIERRSNLEAFLAHMTGRVSPVPCKCCKKGFGPWTECVIYDGQMCGSCTNCWYNASGSRCTFHGKPATHSDRSKPLTSSKMMK